MATKKTTTKTTTRKKNGKVTKVTTTIETVETTPAPPKYKTHLIIALDDSGSMSGCYDKAVEQVNQNIDIARKKSAEKNLDTTVTLYLFGDRVKNVYTRKPIAEVPNLSTSFDSGGSTKLLDAACGSIDDAFKAPDANDPNTSFLALVCTDGGENSSTKYRSHDMERLLKAARETGRWTNVFMVPGDGQAKREMMRWGVSADNILEWENTRKGAEIGFARTNASTGTYFESRSVGLRSTEKFYVDTDLSELTKAEIQKKLVDIQSNFKAVQVDKEVSIKEFAEAKTGKPYVIGSVFYALTKKEKVQPQKSVLIVEKGKRSVWGGPEARDLLGLPQGKLATVNPGNHAQYDVYVKSTSVNRKLVRGTKILIDLTKTTNDAETWDSAKAKADADAKAALLAQQNPTT